ncbi:MAG: hypothetical protein Q7S22_05290 [Candidatus Micrarchaeota archaeon]|nr:hypothetical protein [Candidatus Micrarchaeota archaeon]
MKHVKLQPPRGNKKSKALILKGKSILEEPLVRSVKDTIHELLKLERHEEVYYRFMGKSAKNIRIVVGFLKDNDPKVKLSATEALYKKTMEGGLDTCPFNEQLTQALLDSDLDSNMDELETVSKLMTMITNNALENCDVSKAIRKIFDSFFYSDYLNIRTDARHCIDRMLHCKSGKIIVKELSRIINGNEVDKISIALEYLGFAGKLQIDISPAVKKIIALLNSEILRFEARAALEKNIRVNASRKTIITGLCEVLKNSTAEQKDGAFRIIRYCNNGRYDTSETIRPLLESLLTEGRIDEGLILLGMSVPIRSSNILKFIVQQGEKPALKFFEEVRIIIDSKEFEYESRRNSENYVNFIDCVAELSEIAGRIINRKSEANETRETATA